MKKIALVALAPIAFGLAACGDSDDASEEAMADTVEIDADEALEGVEEEPVVDEAAAIQPATSETAAPRDAGAAAGVDVDAAGDAAVVAAQDAAAAAAAAAAASADEESEDVPTMADEAE
jgi:hypothetical protein